MTHVIARAAGFAIGADRALLDEPALLRTLVNSRDLGKEFSALEPPFLHYRLLETALRHYQELARQPTLTQLQPLPRHTFRQGDRYDGAPALARLLVAQADLPVDAADSPLSDQALLDGGLIEGLLSRKTYQALTVPLAKRVLQIALPTSRRCP